MRSVGMPCMKAAYDAHKQSSEVVLSINKNADSYANSAGRSLVTTENYGAGSWRAASRQRAMSALLPANISLNGSYAVIRPRNKALYEFCHAQWHRR